MMLRGNVGLKICYLSMTFLSLTILLLMSGCNRRVGGARSLDELSGAANVNAEYRVNFGDTLNVKIWGEPKLSGEVLVREDGRVTMPLIGDVEVEDKTLTQVAELLKTKLKTYVPSASVSVSVSQVAPTRYYLSGAFQKPGEYRSDGRISFLQAVATGGGFAAFANESSLILIRKTKSGELRYNLDYNLVIEGRQPNPVLKDGDIIAAR